MTISVFDLFKIGIGPSSSHTVGPMRAAGLFAAALRDDGLLDQVCGIRAELFGSLGATGHGHGSVKAVVLGLSGEQPESVDPVAAGPMVAAVRESGRLRLLGSREIAFDPDEDIVLHRRKRLPFHPNGMRFAAPAPVAGSSAPGRTTRSAAASCWARTRPASRRSWPTRRRCPTRSAPAPSCSRTPAGPGCRSAASCWPTSWSAGTPARSRPACCGSGR